MEKTVVILRGWPGSGKSYSVKEMIKDLEPQTFKIISADHFFLNKEGVYNFDPNRLGAAHASCEKIFLESLLLEIPLLIIDNTNIVYSDCKYYIKWGAIAGYAIKLKESSAPWRNDPLECFQRNVHGVPLETIERMQKRYQTNEEVIGWAKTNLSVDVTPLP